MKTKLNKKHIIIYLVILFLLIGGGLLWDHLDEMNEQKQIQAVQNATISDGITILEVIEAHTGEKGSWHVVGEEIKVDAYDIDTDKSIHAWFLINKKTKSIDIKTFLIDLYEPCDEQDLKMCLQELVQEALNKR